MGRCKSGAQKRVKKPDEDIEDPIPVVSVDHMGQTREIRNQKYVNLRPSW